MSGLCYWLGFYELLMAARLHALTWRIWLLLFVSAHSHCTACNRGQCDRGDQLAFKARIKHLPRVGKIPRGRRSIGEGLNFLLPSSDATVAGLLREKTRLEKVEANCASVAGFPFASLPLPPMRIQSAITVKRRSWGIFFSPSDRLCFSKQIHVRVYFEALFLFLVFLWILAPLSKPALFSWQSSQCTAMPMAS